MTEPRWVALLLTATSLALLALTVELQPLARYAPLAVLLPTAALLVVELGSTWLRQPASDDTTVALAPVAGKVRIARRVVRGNGDDSTRRRREGVFLAWLVGLVSGVLLLGILAMPLFMTAWFRCHARQGWPLAVAAGIVTMLLAGAGPHVIGLRLPQGVVPRLLGL